jgi:hypothetical protein
LKIRVRQGASWVDAAHQLFQSASHSSRLENQHFVLIF